MCPLYCFYVFYHVCITCGIRKRTKYHLRGEFLTQLYLACPCVNGKVSFCRSGRRGARSRGLFLMLRHSNAIAC